MSADAFIENDISTFQVDVKGLEPATYWERGKAGCREDSFLAAGSANATDAVIMQHGVNYHPRSGWLEFVRRFMVDKGHITPVLSTLNLHPGAKHPVCFARISQKASGSKEGPRPAV